MAPTAIDHAEPSRTRGRGRSLRLRIGGWTILVFTLMLALFTIIGVIEDRHEILRAQGEQARGLLTHLVKMPEFQGDLRTMGSHLTAISDSLSGMGGTLEVVPTAKEAEAGLLARQPLSLAGGNAEGSLELRYLGDVTRLQKFTRRSVVLHVIHGLLTLAVLLAGMEWILRRNLIAPLQSLSHQVDRMRRGGGWVPVMPPTDVELDGLAGAVNGLGPALEKQVHVWVNAERHSAVTLALSHIRVNLKGPLRDIRGLIGDLEARHLVAPSGKPRLRSILANFDRVLEALMTEDEVELAQSRWRGPTPGDGSPDI